MVIIAEIKSDGNMVGALVANAKQFKTGSRGFFGTGKIEMAGKRYQAQIQLVEIGSKTTGESGAEPAPAENRAPDAGSPALGGGT